MSKRGGLLGWLAGLFAPKKLDLKGSISVVPGDSLKTFHVSAANCQLVAGKIGSGQFDVYGLGADHPEHLATVEISRYADGYEVGVNSSRKFFIRTKGQKTMDTHAHFTTEATVTIGNASIKVTMV